MLKQYKLKFSDLTIEPKVWLKDYSSLFWKWIMIKSLLKNQDVTSWIKSGRTPSKFNEDYWNWEYDFLTMQDVDTSMFWLKKECSDKITDFAVKNENTLYQAKKWSLIISNAMTVWLTFMTDRDIYLNQNVFDLNFDEKKVNKKFLLWYFNLHLKPIFEKLFASKYLSKEELWRIKIPNLPLPTQNKIVSKIEPIEQKIKELKSQIKEQKDVINLVFAREFWFDENIANEFGKWMTALTQSLKDRKLKVNNTNFNELVKSEIVRVSTRFHNDPTKKLMEILDSLKTIEINKVIESYEKWVQPEYDTDWNIDVIKITNLKNWYIDFSETEKISQEYYNSLKEAKKLKENDIIICATWKWSLWKIDLFKWKYEAITAADNYIIRVNNKINPLFFTYYFRSILGFFQVERDYTGATNQIHLYWDQIWKWKIPDLPLPKQQKIVDEIKKELDKQEKIKRDIEGERKKIDVLIEEGINSI